MTFNDEKPHDLMYKLSITLVYQKGHCLTQIKGNSHKVHDIITYKLKHYGSV